LVWCDAHRPHVSFFSNSVVFTLIVGVAIGFVVWQFRNYFLQKQEKEKLMHALSLKKDNPDFFDNGQIQLEIFNLCSTTSNKELGKKLIHFFFDKESTQYSQNIKNEINEELSKLRNDIINKTFIFGIGFLIVLLIWFIPFIHHVFHHIFWYH
jgi:hypothetical protein